MTTLSGNPNIVINYEKIEFPELETADYVSDEISDAEEIRI